MTKNKGGRPTAFREEYCQKLIDHMAEGFTFESFAGLINVNADTLYEWCKVHPEFMQAKREGRTKQLYANEKTLRDIARGKIRGANVTAQIFIMKNCHRWTDRLEQTNIDLSKEDTAKLKEEAAQLLKELE